MFWNDIKETKKLVEAIAQRLVGISTDSEDGDDFNCLFDRVDRIDESLRDVKRLIVRLDIMISQIDKK